MVLMVKNPPASAGDIRDLGSIPGPGGSSGGGHGNPLQYACLENPMDRGIWQVTVLGVAKSWTRLKQFGAHTHTHTHTQMQVKEQSFPGGSVVKNPPAKQETQVRSPGGEDPLEKEMATH